jgi:hypothetical protein
MITPTGRQRTVIRASSDWHIYQRNRDIYGLSSLGCGAQDAPHVHRSTDLDAAAGL